MTKMTRMFETELLN